MTSAIAALQSTDILAAAREETSILHAIESPLENLQRELDNVRSELELLRGRDNLLRSSLNRLDEELRLAARVQQDFLPKSLPQLGAVRFHTLFRPAGHVSGDLYDVMRLDEHHVGFYLADAVGHGMPAALLTMFLKQALVTKQINAEGYRLLGPAQTMQKLNGALVERNLSEVAFATAVYGHINTNTLKLTLSVGGHPSPLLLTPDGTLKTVDGDGPLLGVFPNEEFSETTIQLHPGERLFVYSDGIELAFTDTEMSNTLRWRQELLNHRSLPTEQIIQEFAVHVDEVGHAHNREQDDLTIIVVEVAPAN